MATGTYFLYSKWLELPLTTRMKIAEQFSIVKRGSTHVENDRVVSDGYLVKEIEQALSIDAIQRYVDTETLDVELLWDMMMDKIEGRLVVTENPIQEEEPPKVVVVEPTKVDKRKRK